MIHLGNIDADLGNADWIKSTQDLRASGVDVDAFLAANPDLPIARRAKAQKSFGDPGNTQTRDEGGRFGPSSGAPPPRNDPTPSRPWSGPGLQGRESIVGSHTVASAHDTNTLYLNEDHARDLYGTGAALEQDMAQKMSDEIWAQYSGLPQEDAPQVLLEHSDIPEARDAVRTGTLGLTEQRLETGMSYAASGRTQQIKLFPGGMNEMTLYHEIAHSIVMTKDNNMDHGAAMRETYLGILRGEGLGKIADIVAKGASPNTAWTKSEGKVIATLHHKGVLVCTLTSKL